MVCNNKSHHLNLPIFIPLPFSVFLQGNTIPGVLKFHGVITTFEMIMADCPELKKLHWRCVVIDEAHRLKNRNCKLLEGLKLMNLVSLCVFGCMCIKCHLSSVLDKSYVSIFKIPRKLYFVVMERI